MIVKSGKVNLKTVKTFHMSLKATQIYTDTSGAWSVVDLGQMNFPDAKCFSTLIQSEVNLYDNEFSRTIRHIFHWSKPCTKGLHLAECLYSTLEEVLGPVIC